MQADGRGDDGRRHATTITHRALLGVGAIKPTRKAMNGTTTTTTVSSGATFLRPKWNPPLPAQVTGRSLASPSRFSSGKQKKGVPLRRRMEMAPLAWRWWLLHKTGKGGATPLLLCETHTIGRKSLEIDPLFFSGSVGADVQT